MLESSGASELDEVLYGEVFSTVGRFTLYKQTEPIVVDKRPESGIHELLPKLGEISNADPRAIRQINNLVLIYTGDFDLQVTYDVVSARFNCVRVVFCVGLAATAREWMAKLIGPRLAAATPGTCTGEVCWRLLPLPS